MITCEKLEWCINVCNSKMDSSEMRKSYYCLSNASTQRRKSYSWQTKLKTKTSKGHCGLAFILHALVLPWQAIFKSVFPFCFTSVYCKANRASSTVDLFVIRLRHNKDSVLHLLHDNKKLLSAWSIKRSHTGELMVKTTWWKSWTVFNLLQTAL